MSNSDHTDDQQFFNMFMVVIGALIATALGLAFLARSVGADTQVAWVKEDPDYITEVDARVKPVGQVHLPGDVAATGAVATAAVAAPPAAKLTGEQVYNSACFACHGAGVGGAPKFGDAASWAPHIAKGAATLHKHAIEGFQGQLGYMPPKGGRVDLSDEEVMAAVDYMAGFK
ncbi:MAG: c-type cytochrome [Gammaproteobacteria bacterium]